jgi:dephospho-CoA kinase
MGKSVAADQLRAMGYPVFEADRVVHDLYLNKDVKAALTASFPDLSHLHHISRADLAKRAEQDPSTYDTLEQILHPLVQQREQEFTEDCKARGVKMAVYDIPLLYEKDRAKEFNFVAVVTAPALIQLWRVMRRPGMTWLKFQQILSRQMEDADKRHRADFVVHTGYGKTYARWQWRKIINTIALN